MNIEEFIETIRDAIDLIEQLDEPQPLKLKDITSRMKELDSHARSEWIDVILHEFGEEFGSKKYRDGYEQGKLEGTIERVKPVVPQSVADWIDACKENLAIGLYTAMNPNFLKQWNKSDELICWIKKARNQDIFARAWVDGYEVEKEVRYMVRFKNIGKIYSYLNYDTEEQSFKLSSKTESMFFKPKFTKEFLEKNSFGWVFDCEGIEIEEVK